MTLCDERWKKFPLLDSAILLIYSIQKGMARKMNQSERWNQFAATGRVMDYLEYKQSIESQETVKNCGGNGTYGRYDNRDGTDTDSITIKGIR